MAWFVGRNHGDNLSTHQRFVKTTPKPRATKKRRGEEPEFPPPPPWPPPPPLLSPVPVDVGRGSEEKVGEVEGKPVGEGARVDEAVGLEEGVVRVLETCLTWLRRVRAAKSTKSWPPRAMTTKCERVRSLLETQRVDIRLIQFGSVCCRRHRGQVDV